MSTASDLIKLLKSLDELKCDRETRVAALDAFKAMQVAETDANALTAEALRGAVMNYKGTPR